MEVSPEEYEEQMEEYNAKVASRAEGVLAKNTLAQLRRVDPLTFHKHGVKHDTK